MYTFVRLSVDFVKSDLTEKVSSESERACTDSATLALDLTKH